MFLVVNTFNDAVYISKRQSIAITNNPPSFVIHYSSDECCSYWPTFVLRLERTGRVEHHGAHYKPKIVRL